MNNTCGTAISPSMVIASMVRTAAAFLGAGFSSAAIAVAKLPAPKIAITIKRTFIGLLRLLGRVAGRTDLGSKTGRQIIRIVAGYFLVFREPLPPRRFVEEIKRFYDRHVVQRTRQLIVDRQRILEVLARFYRISGVQERDAVIVVIGRTRVVRVQRLLGAIESGLGILAAQGQVRARTLRGL